MELERIVIAQEDNTFPLTSQERLPDYRNESRLWVRFAASIADKIGPKPRLNMTITSYTYSSGSAESTAKHFLKTVRVDTPKIAIGQRSGHFESITNKPITTRKTRKIRGSKMRKIDESFC